MVDENEHTKFAQSKIKFKMDVSHLLCILFIIQCRFSRKRFCMKDLLSIKNMKHVHETSILCFVYNFYAFKLYLS